MKRHYCVALQDGVVVGSRRAYYPIVVIHFGAGGPFASFHPSEAHAKAKGLAMSKDTAPHKLIQPSIETTTYVPVGTTLTPDLVVPR